VLRVDGALNFANAEHIRRLVIERVDARGDLAAVVLDGRGINGIDATAVGVLSDLLDALDGRGVPLHLTRFKGPARRVIARSRLRSRFAGTSFELSPREVIELLRDTPGAPDPATECPPGTPGGTQGPDPTT